LKTFGGLQARELRRDRDRKDHRQEGRALASFTGHHDQLIGTFNAVGSPPTQ
jgi:hypothetical protein